MSAPAPVETPEMAWLDEPPAGQMSQDEDGESPPADGGAGEARSGPLGRLKAVVAALAICAMGLATVLVWPEGEPKSAALEAERGPPDAPDPVEMAVGAASPLSPPAAKTAAPPAAEDDVRPSGDPVPAGPTPGAGPPDSAGRPAAAPRPEGAPPDAAAPVTDVDIPVQGQATVAAAPPADPKTSAPAPVAADLSQRLAVMQALVERLERSGRVLSARLDGLELLAQRQPAADAAEALADEAEPAAAPAPARTAKRKPHARKRPAPPPAEPAAPRRPMASEASLPFSVESVDTWNGAKTVVIRDGQRLLDLRPGDRHGEWRVESADGQSVTLIGPDGGSHVVRAGASP